MTTPDPSILTAVRSQIEQGLEHLTIACGLLRQNGWPENADELMRTVRHGRVWTQSDGWLDHLAPPARKG
jgi:hypothetical protein